MKLYETFPESIEVNGREYTLTLFFDRVLRYFELTEREDLTPDEIFSAGYAWLVETPQRVDTETKYEVLERIVSEIIAPPRRRLSVKKNPPRAVDFGFDAAEIYSSFMRDYGIDLVKEQGRMHWCKFITLFEGLSDDTPIKRIMRVRVQEIPPPNKHNAEEIRRLTELKTLYALPAGRREEQDSRGAWDDIFNAMLLRAGE